jgi:thiamine pyrophosphokinase
MPNHRAVLFVNGLIQDLDAAAGLLLPDDLLIAVDGGARHLAAMSRLPDLLIGDLDSLSAEEVDALREEGVPVQRFPVEKNETDLELAITAALERGANSLVIVGALGGRLDQTLANLFLLNLPALAGMDARLDDGIDEVFLIREHTLVHGRPGDTLSLLPLGGAAHGVSTQGLRYPLRGETLLPEKSRGVSNELVGERAEISLTEGTLICIHTRL